MNALRSEFYPTTTTTTEGGASSGKRSMEFNANVINDTLAATRASASWKAGVQAGAEKTLNFFVEYRVLTSGFRRPA